jgi:hypothetical protein
MAKMGTRSLLFSSIITDPDGGPYTLSGSYTYNGGAAITLPSGIFSFPSTDTLYAASTSFTDIGIY